jgi:hypothetical protein
MNVMRKYSGEIILLVILLALIVVLATNYTG